MSTDAGFQSGFDPETLRLQISPGEAWIIESNEISPVIHLQLVNAYYALT
jgi:hypothetical protein